MARPNKNRMVGFNPNVSYFKPMGIPTGRLEEVTLTVDECEAVRLADFLDMSQEDAGREMGVSRSTFGRIIQRARKTLADALINGRAIRIEGGKYQYVTEPWVFFCDDCHHQWEPPPGNKRPVDCPECRCEKINRV